VWILAGAHVAPKDEFGRGIFTINQTFPMGWGTNQPVNHYVVFVCNGLTQMKSSGTPILTQATITVLAENITRFELSVVQQMLDFFAHVDIG
jgi:hypothetical protein